MTGPSPFNYLHTAQDNSLLDEEFDVMELEPAFEQEAKVVASDDIAWEECDIDHISFLPLAA